MLPALVITLREGLEAALIVGIVAAFLKQRGRGDALRWVWLGVALAVALCSGVAVGLHELGRELPQAQQEGLETVVGAIAVCMVSWMIFWMRAHARGLKREIENAAASALAQGSMFALVGMAFLAVLREGCETAVFLLAIFQSTTAPAATSFGAIVGLVIACVIGYGIYAGGIVVNLGKVFRATGVVLALVAAGVASNAVHTAHEAGWLNSLQQQALDLHRIIHPGTPFAALMAGLFGVQSRPAVGEVLAYAIVGVALLIVVLYPQKRRARAGGTVTAMAALSALAICALIASGCSSSSTQGAVKGGQNVTIALTDHGCSPNSVEAPAGPVNFHVTNSGTSAVTELEVMQGSRIIGERENVVPGIDGTFSLDLTKGTYVLNCPGGSNAHGTLTVTGTAKALPNSEAVAKAQTAYQAYLATNASQLVANAKLLQSAIASGNLATAQAAYPAGRVNYERIEPVAESFGNLDPEIDARITDPHPGAWSGFHPIEQLLFQKHTLQGAAPLAAGLVANTETLQQKIATLSKLQPAELANGSSDLMHEVATSKITGEEERYSHIDLLDFQANLDGAQEAASLLYPILSANGHADLVTTLETQFANVQKALGPYHHGQSYEKYTQLTPADTAALAQAVNALVQPLDTVSKFVA